MLDTNIIRGDLRYTNNIVSSLILFSGDSITTVVFTIVSHLFRVWVLCNA